MRLIPPHLPADYTKLSCLPKEIWASLLDFLSELTRLAGIA
jgi:hypothetical protein